ncbi:MULTISPECIES: L,D-transpeptidase [Mesobacillus]|uniref:L,D-transpeptidase n=2 Tax=Mesobacillus TaxID=2675231 RepID=A0A0D6ZBN7_9BACI|nr:MULTISPECIES: L,D-transpeptidase [Mesobacillus]KIY21993.1 L,D-transpeptidase [Mesobacillus subterraneus]MDQ0413739.1 lipoprotein-anchoring transpeptidase ErfK/SrfK [Mesobacillus stamsii]
MPMFISMLLAVFIFSPVWPLGTNPLPGDPFVIVNKKTNEVALINENRVQTVVSAATGKSADLTPEGLFTITVKAANPYYRKLDIPGGDPRNPLGSRWIGFDAENTDGRTYGIHGTNDPSSIGKKVSKGCVRLQNEAVDSLYEYIPLGTKILITSTEKSFLQLGQEHGAIRTKK